MEEQPRQVFRMENTAVLFWTGEFCADTLLNKVFSIDNLFF